ncbi:MAG: NAD(P)-binding protein [Deltaproteobacteria bacterium]|nr:NAD(P)-binding protein [Deltaproteobacteria bacterium]
MKKVNIIGGGINGLLLAALLSKDGYFVNVFEKRKNTGGRAFLYEKDGFVIDNGLHITRFGPHSPVGKVMKYIGKEIKYKKMGKSYLINNQNKKYNYPRNPIGFLTSNMFSISEKLQIAKLMLSVKRGDFNHMDDIPLIDWMDQQNVRGGIKLFFEMLSGSMMVCPFIGKTSSGDMFRIMQRMVKLGRTIEYPANGWKPIYEGLTSQIEKNGKINLKNKVDEVILNGVNAKGVLIDGIEIQSDIVVINLPVQDLFTVLPEERFPNEYVDLCKNILPTSGTFIDIALDKCIGKQDGLLYTYDPVTIGMITSNVAKNIAPTGKQLLTFWYPTSREDVLDKKMKPMMLKSTIDLYAHKSSLVL